MPLHGGTPFRFMAGFTELSGMDSMAYSGSSGSGSAEGYKNQLSRFQKLIMDCSSMPRCSMEHHKLPPLTEDHWRTVMC